MNWIICAIGVLTFSPVIYVFLRLAKEYKTKVEIQNFYLFFIPLFGFLVFNLIMNYSFIIDIKYLIIIILDAVFLSYLGNVFSLKGINNAPNAGYSLMIIKSNTIMTSILAIFLFGATLKLKNVIGIIIVLCSMTLILIEKKDKNDNKSSNPWILYTFIAFFAFGFQTLILTYLGKKGVPSSITLFYLCTIVIIIIIAELIIKKIKIQFDKKNLVTMIGIGIGSTFFNTFLAYGYISAPNTGYMNAINAGSVAILTILYYFIFKDNLSKQKLIGVIGVLLGLILLLI